MIEFTLLLGEHMLYIKIFLTFVLFVNFAYATPQWFTERSIAHQPFVIIGYGSGETKEIAYNNAISEIANQINVFINVRMDISESNISERYIKRDINSISSLNLYDLESVKTDYVHDSYYIAVKFNNLPLVSRVIYSAGASICDKKEDNMYLLSTQFAAEFINQIGCFPKMVWNSNSGGWSLTLNDKSFHVPSHEFVKLFADVHSDTVHLTSSKKLLKENEIYHYLIDISEPGRLSLYQANSRGSVSILLSNIDIKNNSSLIFPDLKIYDGIEALISNNAETEKDIAIAILCSKPIDNGLFSEISTDMPVPNFSFFSLLDIIKNCKIASFVTEVRK